MVQLARIFFPGSPHLVTQRGNRREMVFFEPDDYRAYLELLAEATRKAETQVWAYCPMPNHVHLILLPRHGDSLRATLADTHRQHTRRINARKQWTGHLWQGRFSSVTMDEGHLASAERYVSLNPVREGLVGRSADWPGPASQRICPAGRMPWPGTAGTRQNSRFRRPAGKRRG